MKITDPEQTLIDLAVSCRRDPLRFVMLAYPWGEPGTWLEKHPGPDSWQAEVLAYVRDNLGLGRPVRIAIAGGVGPGKTALMSWVLNWGMTTGIDCRGRVTANTGPQITTSTWPEITRWFRESLWASWFDIGERRIRSVDDRHRDSWRLDALTWDEHRPEAFRGLHNAGRRIIYGFDEASAIAKPIFDASEGILAGATDTEIIWLCMSNPTRTDTEFRTFFPGGRNDKYWKTWHIDTRTSRMSDKKQIAEWKEIYGEDHDYFRVNVLSQFPRAGSLQFIGEGVVNLAASRPDIVESKKIPLVIGVDVARFGDDQSVIYFRRGRDGRSIKPLKFRGLDTMQLSAQIAEVHEKYKPKAIFIDEGGVGGGVVDRCRYLQLPVTGVQFGGKPVRLMQLGDAAAVTFANRRAEMWGLMKEWLSGGAIPDDRGLREELTSVQYGYTIRDGRDSILLERKEDMKKRGLSSPDVADALALTFAEPAGYGDEKPGKHLYDYDPAAGLYRSGAGYA